MTIERRDISTRPSLFHARSIEQQKALGGMIGAALKRRLGRGDQIYGPDIINITYADPYKPGNSIELVRAAIREIMGNIPAQKIVVQDYPLRLSVVALDALTGAVRFDSSRLSDERYLWLRYVGSTKANPRGVILRDAWMEKEKSISGSWSRDVNNYHPEWQMTLEGMPDLEGRMGYEIIKNQMAANLRAAVSIHVAPLPELEILKLQETTITRLRENIEAIQSAHTKEMLRIMSEAVNSEEAREKAAEAARQCIDKLMPENQQIVAAIATVRPLYAYGAEGIKASRLVTITEHKSGVLDEQFRKDAAHLRYRPFAQGAAAPA
jgi:hypothetical protein